MIEFVNGKLEVIDPQYVVVETGGIGYQIFCPNPFVFESYRNKQVKIYTYQYVREDVIRLYGFLQREERKMFEKLLNVSGIGPKGALAILASGQPDHLVTAIEQENENFLVKFPGVGKKTARQMILDLKGKLAEFSSDAPLFAEQVEQKSTDLEEAIEALKALGYVDKEIKKVLPQLEKETMSTDQYIKRALQLMLM
ncbi:Holliday junction branch migration protein RuvA [Alkalihalobacterium bogoriense]|uniref:Holliday junction branch migration protein RuvA n=1 Tax=Alkalihalobacterium bogoriense TaxID=246272 RepID=UPI000478DC40|nr:Holliday junction branch migration protein RuvA [Alkalihalobacterium bogoriense]